MQNPDVLFREGVNLWFELTLLSCCISSRAIRHSSEIYTQPYAQNTSLTMYYSDVCGIDGLLAQCILQVMVVPISEASLEYAQQVRSQLRKAKLHVDVDATDRKMQKKVREAQLAQYNYILVSAPAVGPTLLQTHVTNNQYKVCGLRAVHGSYHWRSVLLGPCAVAASQCLRLVRFQAVRGSKLWWCDIGNSLGTLYLLVPCGVMESSGMCSILLASHLLRVLPSAAKICN